MSFKATAPGSLMLLGEYAVLQESHAVVCAIDKRMTVILSPRQDKQVILKSALGEYETTISNLTAVAPFQFVLAALDFVKNHLKQGCEIQITSEFSATVGFASSAAVTVATLAALSAWLNLHWSDRVLVQKARQVIQSVQGLGSGADVAACVMGGMVAYRRQPFKVEKLPFIHPITVIYSGSKTPTVEAVTRVKNYFSQYPNLYQSICCSIDNCARAGIEAIKQQNWQQLGVVMNVQQGLMDALGVNTEILSKIIELARQQSSLLGVKISGSGLGDCIVALGEATSGMFDSLLPNVKEMQVGMTSEGVFCEKI